MALCDKEFAFIANSQCRYLDISLGFQYRMMWILPLSIFIFGSLLKFIKMAIDNNSRVTRRWVDIISLSKVVFLLVELASISSVINLTKGPFSNIATAAYVLQLVATILMLPLSYVQHIKEFAPSTLICSHKALVSIFSSVQLRTFYNARLTSESYFAPYCVFFAAACSSFLIELSEKRWLMIPSIKPKATEVTSSIPSRITFAFLYPVLFTGFRKALNLDDVNEFGLPDELSSNNANKRFNKFLNIFRKKDKQPILLPSIIAFYDHFFAAVIPKLLYVAVTFAQPFLVSRMLAFIDSYTTDTEASQDPNVGWALVGAYAVVYLSLAATTALYWDKVYAMVIRYRAALVSVLFDKSVKLSASVAENEGRGSAVTYMSVDVERVVEGVIFFHECWSALVSIACAAVILWYQATYAMIPPLCVMVGFFIVTSIVGKRVSGAQKRWMGSTESRLAVIGSVMSQIIPTKLLGLEPTMPNWINPLRVQEVDHLKAFYRRLVIVVVLSSATINCAGLSALGTFAGISGDIKPQTLFTIYTIVNLVTLPISTVGHCFPLLVASWASMKRIAKFLMLEERSVNNRMSEDVSSSSNSIDSLKSDNDEKKSLESAKYYDGPPTLWQLNVSSNGKSDGKDILNDINVRFPLNKLSMIVGPVGSGKSILLKTLLGETYITTGIRKVGGHSSSCVAYAPQEAFIWPTTIRENIILDSEFDPQWYHTVIEACAMKYDLARMRKGDLTVLTEKGGGISGGQKQRISLARTIYASRKSSLTILDDCFSALDGHTTKHVFTSLFGRFGLLKKKTVIMVTHSHKHLSAADHVLALEGGTILAQGTIKELYSSVIDVKAYIGEIPKEDEVDDEVVVDDRETIQVKKDDTEREISELKIPALEVKPGEDDSKLIDDDEEEEDAAAQLGWKPYIFYMQSCGWGRLSICIVFLFLYNALEVGLQIYLEKWSSADTTNHKPWLGGYAGFTVAAFLSSLCMMWTYTQYTSPRASLRMHESMLNSVLKASVPYFQKTSSALLNNRWGSDMFISDFAFPISMLDFSLTAVYVVGAAILILIAVPWLAISIPLLVAIYWSLQRVYLATSRQLQRLTISSKTPLYTSFSTLLTGLVTIRAFKADKLFKDISEFHLNRSQAPMYYRDSGIRFLRTFLNFITAFIAIGIAAIAVGLRNSTSAGYLGVALSQLVSMATSLTNLLLAWTRVENGVVSLERIVEITEIESEEKGYNEDCDNENGEENSINLSVIEPPSDWPSKGHIVFENVELKYNEKMMKNALDNVTYSIEGSNKLGICGRTGSGKSSTIYALLRGQKLNSGKIYIDGVDLSTVPLLTLRSRISTVSQDPFLLHATIKENLKLGCEDEDLVDNDQIWDALEKVGMGDKVKSLDQGLETQVTTDGMEFSAGERQLLCIARVLLQKRKIVVLDEASSSMDTKTDEKLLDVLKHSLAGITVISVAHRISTIDKYDKVIVMDEGKIVEIGNPQHLLQDTESKFRGLAESQGVV